MGGLELAVVEAAKALCKTINEEQLYEIQVASMGNPELDEFVAKMIDLGQAVMELESAP